MYKKEKDISQHQINTKIFKPYYLQDVIRLGSRDDGGYVINSRIISITTVLVSLGIEKNFSFEQDFKKINSEVVIFGVDKLANCCPIKAKDFILCARVLAVFWKALSKKNRRWMLQRLYNSFLPIQNSIRQSLHFAQFYFKKQVSFINAHLKISGSWLTPKKLFDKISQKTNVENNSICIKIDIEGDEYSVMPELLVYAEKINSFIVEFHALDTQWDTFCTLLHSIFSKNFIITHAHGNNWESVIPGTTIPKVLELTFIKKSFLQLKEINSPLKNNIQYPIKDIDYPNNANIPDIPLFFEKRIFK